MPACGGMMQHTNGGIMYGCGYGSVVPQAACTLGRPVAHTGMMSVPACYGGIHPMYEAYARADVARLSQERKENERQAVLRVREAEARAFHGLPPLF